ncbi:MAG: carboxypeptidase-like regulatory domain-containing protein [Myxococcaceae bacterium]
MRLARSLFVLSAVGALAACGPQDANGDGIADGIRTPDTVTEVAPSTPVGTVSGQVLNSRFQGLAGVDVTLNVGAVGTTDSTMKASTDADGFYAFKGVPAQTQILITMSKAGFGSARTQVVVPGAAGNFPINNGNAQASPFVLTELNGSVKFLVVSSGGRPAKGAKATLEAWPAALELSTFSSGYGAARGTTVVDATAGDDGMVTFSGIPTGEEMTRVSGHYSLHIQPYDENGDNIVDSGGWNEFFNGSDFLTDGTIRVINLPTARATGNFEIVSSNVPSLGSGSLAPVDNMLRPGDPIYIAYSQAIVGASVQVKLTDEGAFELLPQVATVGATGTTLTIQPSAALASGARYNLSVRAVSADTGATLSADGYFFGGDPATPKPFALTSITFKDQNLNATLDNGETVFATFNQPIGGFPASFGTHLYLFINQDIGTPVGGTAGTIGDFPGELNFRGTASPPSPFELFVSEPPPLPANATLVLAPRLIGYGSVWTARLPISVSVPNGTQMQIQFNREVGTGFGHQTAWGQVITQDTTASLAIAQ